MDTTTEKTARPRSLGRLTRSLTVTCLGACLGLAATSFSGTVNATGWHGTTKEKIYWVWKDRHPVGHSKLTRDADGLTATIKTHGLGRGNVVTLWFIVFNNPAACFSTPCTGADLGGGNPDAQSDFIYGGGTVTSRSQSRFGGSLAVGDASGSGFIEFGEVGLGLTDPFGAEVHVALHSHGPATSGADLKAQISSYLGGCAAFLGGPDGFADSREDIPDEAGECSTIQASIHQP